MKRLCDQSSPQMGPFLPNEVGRIAEHIRKGEERTEGKDGDHLIYLVQYPISLLKRPTIDSL